MLRTQLLQYRYSVGFGSFSAGGDRAGATGTTIRAGAGFRQAQSFAEDFLSQFVKPPGQPHTPGNPVVDHDHGIRISQDALIFKKDVDILAIAGDKEGCDIDQKVAQTAESALDMHGCFGKLVASGAETYKIIRAIGCSRIIKTAEGNLVMHIEGSLRLGGTTIDTTMAVTIPDLAAESRPILAIIVALVAPEPLLAHFCNRFVIEADPPGNGIERAWRQIKIFIAKDFLREKAKLLKTRDGGGDFDASQVLASASYFFVDKELEQLELYLAAGLGIVVCDDRLKFYPVFLEIKLGYLPGIALIQINRIGMGHPVGAFLIYITDQFATMHQTHLAGGVADRDLCRRIGFEGFGIAIRYFADFTVFKQDLQMRKELSRAQITEALIFPQRKIGNGTEQMPLQDFRIVRVDQSLLGIVSKIYSGCRQMY